jgi:SAM-dependent methyltransferase
MKKSLQRTLQTLPHGKILDVATGKGASLTWLIESVQKGQEVHARTLGIGIDREKRIVKKARIQPDTIEGATAHFLVMDAATLGFRDASFEIAAIVNSLHHLTDPQAVLSAMKRILKPEGHVLICEMYRDVKTPVQRMHVDLHHWWADVDTGQGITHRKTFTRQAILDLVQPLGFKALTTYDISDPEQDPFDEALHTELNLAINLYLQRAKALPTYDQLARRAEVLRERLKRIGLQWASQLAILAQP